VTVGELDALLSEITEDAPAEIAATRLALVVEGLVELAGPAGDDFLRQSVRAFRTLASTVRAAVAADDGEIEEE